MDFEFDDDQLNLQRMAQDVLAKECPSTLLRSVYAGEDDASGLWATLVSLDWPGLAIAVEDGGVGATAVELAIVVEQLGAVADPTPFLATTTQFAPLVSACGDDGQRRRFLGPVAEGTTTGTLVLSGPGGRWDPAAPAIRAERRGDSWTLSGTAAFVLDGDRVDELAVLASTDDGSAVFVVPAAETVTSRVPALDHGLHLAEVTFDDVAVDDDRRLAHATPDAVQSAYDQALTGVALTMVGACQRALDMVLDYVKERHQFGVPIGSFQAVKHKSVDMYMTIERARALGYFAALTIAADDERRTLAASMAKAAAGEAQRLVVQHAIQLFGGIGFTWENDLHLYLRRAKAGELIFGGAADHRAVIGRQVMAATTAGRPS